MTPTDQALYKELADKTLSFGCKFYIP